MTKTEPSDLMVTTSNDHFEWLPAFLVRKAELIEGDLRGDPENVLTPEEEEEVWEQAKRDAAESRRRWEDAPSWEGGKRYW